MKAIPTSATLMSMYYTFCVKICFDLSNTTSKHDIFFYPRRTFLINTTVVYGEATLYIKNAASTFSLLVAAQCNYNAISLIFFKKADVSWPMRDSILYLGR